jgi:hypothetical protein
MPSVFYHFVVKGWPTNRSAVRKVRLIVETNEIYLRDALTLVGKKYDDDSFVSRICVVTCDDYCLMESLDISLGIIDSPFTPLTGPTAKGIHVEVGPLRPPSPRPARDAFAMMMAPPVATFLPVLVSSEGEARPIGNIQDQLRNAVSSFYVEIGLGYFDAATEGLLKVNLTKIVNLLCFVDGHWKALFKSDTLPNNAAVQSSQLLRLTMACIRTNSR